MESLISYNVVLAIIGTLFCNLSEVQNLELDSVREGACKGIHYKVQENIDLAWFANANLSYISAGNKYHLYKFAELHPHFADMTEDEFYYFGCFRANMMETTGEASGFGNPVLGRYNIRFYPEAPGVVDFTSVANPHDTSRHFLTLTDNRSFALFANCWMRVQERSWDLISATPTLSQGTQKLVKDHLIKLGFDQKQFAFIRYDSCSNIPSKFRMRW